jgi:TolA-binding protein
MPPITRSTKQIIKTDRATKVNTVPIKTHVRDYVKTHVKEVLYLTSAVVGLLCTVDAYFYSGKDVVYQRHKEMEIVQEMSKTDKKILQLIKELDKKVEMNSKSILDLQHDIERFEIIGNVSQPSQEPDLDPTQ